MKKKWLGASVLAGLLLSQIVLAAIPKFSILPLTPTTIQVPVNSSATVSYLVKNNTNIARQLTIVPIAGVTQLVNSGTCTSPFGLGPGQTCVLSLLIQGNLVPSSGIHTGPVVCKTFGNGNPNPDPFLCSQPNEASVLNVTVLPAGTGHLVWLQNGIPINMLKLLVGSSGVITLSNTGTGPVSNLQISIPAPYSSYFTNGCGTTLAANSSCNITYFIPSPAFLNDFTITAIGSNADNSPLPLPVEISPLGAVQCWGANNVGQLGDGSTSPKDEPLTYVFNLNNAQKVSGGLLYTCALLSTGGVQCWGSNANGELGNPAAIGQSSVPVNVLLSSNTAVDMSAGENHACAVLANGTVQCWGDNNQGKLGTGTVGGNSPVPVTVVGLTNAVEVAAGSNHTCALVTTGQIYCWGYNLEGQLGTGTTLNSPIPVAPVVGINNAVQISSASNTVCALLATGQVQCWGYNGQGQVGNGTFTNALVPNTVLIAPNLPLTNIVDISGRGDHFASVTTTGLVYSWGINGVGQLGNSTTADSPFATLTQGLNGPVVDVSSNIVHACALLATGRMQCWGQNLNGQLGIGPGGDPFYTTAQNVLNITNGIGLMEHGSGEISCAIVNI